VPSWIGTY